MAFNFQQNQLFTEADECSSNESNNNMDLDSDNKSSDDELELIQFCSFYPQILNSEPSRYNHPKSDDWSTFFALVNQIKNHSIFHSNSNNLQTDVEIQLAVTLYRLGALSTIWNVSMLFGIAEGTVLLFMDRVTTAIRSLKSQYVQWPSGNYKKEIHDKFQEMQGFSLVIGIVDHKGHFIHYDIGWPASVHDAKVFQNSSIYNQQNIFFEEKHGNAWGQSDYDDSQIELQPEEDGELIDQTLESNNIIQKEYAKIK
ncbi:728_t:CDS:2 [Gigaspora rosea]|nr:728_t:CDS:2 [Gigaspora rosea]